MIEKEQVREIVADFLSGSDYFIVDVKAGGNNDLGVEIDSVDGVSIDKCAELTKYIESRLDRDVEDFELEVSSPGLGSPFKVLPQYRKYEGCEVEVSDATGIKYQGILKDVTENGFNLDVTKTVKPEGAKRKKEIVETISFRYENIKYTKYTIRFK